MTTGCIFSLFCALSFWHNDDVMSKFFVFFWFLLTANCRSFVGCWGGSVGERERSPTFIKRQGTCFRSRARHRRSKPRLRRRDSSPSYRSRPPTAKHTRTHTTDVGIEDDGYRVLHLPGRQASLSRRWCGCPSPGCRARQARRRPRARCGHRSSRTLLALRRGRGIREVVFVSFPPPRSSRHYRAAPHTLYSLEALSPRTNDIQKTHWGAGGEKESEGRLPRPAPPLSCTGTTQIPTHFALPRSFFSVLLVLSLHLLHSLLLTQHNMTKHSHAHTKTHKQARGPAPFASMP